ncbi:MAG: putative toxin-antitoxin system toxin component, PIN family [Candidatus Levybacteria bacterium]|nr:putative toxin-antitoxin system toxin component, PIN family [Candidatus Levybacteria bacterium]
MNLGTEESLVKIVLDTNVLVSAIHFGGKPRKILNLIEDPGSAIVAITSPILLAELVETFIKKFNFDSEHTEEIKAMIEESFELVYPKEELQVTRDNDDNRVLEAALEGKCNYIITGDKDLLDLKTFKNIKIVTPDVFLSEF